MNSFMYPCVFYQNHESMTDNELYRDIYTFCTCKVQKQTSNENPLKIFTLINLKKKITRKHTECKRINK